MVSIIIPVYKVEKYLSKCIESIFKQTYFDLELILVDDGSPDKCPEICDTYASHPKLLYPGDPISSVGITDHNIPNTIKIPCNCFRDNFSIHA